MRLSVRFKREIVAVAVVVPFLALVLPFGDQPWSIYAALSAAYTILVFGLLWSDGKWRKYIVDNQRRPRDLAQRHTLYLLVLIFWIWFSRFSKPWLPDWMFYDFYKGLTYHLIFSGLGMVAIWWAEQIWLQGPRRAMSGSMSRPGSARWALPSGTGSAG